MSRGKKSGLRDLILRTPVGFRRRYEDLQPERTPRILEVSLTTEERRGRVQPPPPPKKKSSAKVKVPAIIRIVSVQQRVEIVLPPRKADRFVADFGLMFCKLGKKPGTVIARSIQRRFSRPDGEHIVVLLSEAELPLLGVLLHRFAEAQGIIFQEPV